MHDSNGGDALAFLGRIGLTSKTADFAVRGFELFRAARARLLTVAFASQCLFEAALFTRLHVVGVAFDLFDDVLLLNLALKAP